MICPYCENEINDSEQFCPKCGQKLIDTRDSDISQKYWKTVEGDNSKNDKEKADREKAYIREQNSKRRKKLAAVISIAVVLFLVFYTVNATNRSNQGKLPGYYSSMIGNTYSDNKGTSFWIGSSVERVVVEIINENTLSYRSGTWIAKGNGSGAGFTWVENNVSNPVTYDYNLTIGLTGKVSINFNGRTYPVAIEDGNVRSIDFY